MADPYSAASADGTRFPETLALHPVRHHDGSYGLETSAPIACGRYRTIPLAVEGWQKLAPTGVSVSGGVSWVQVIARSADAMRAFLIAVQQDALFGDRRASEPAFVRQGVLPTATHLRLVEDR